MVGQERLEGRSGLRLVIPDDAWIDVEAAGAALHRAEAAQGRLEWQEVWVAARVARHIAVRPFVAGEDAPWIGERRRRLEGTYLRALGLVAHASLLIGGGELDTAERSARTLVQLAPFRERGYRYLMEVLAARDNHADALHVYDRLRTLLRDELGADPSPATQELHRRLLDWRHEGRPGASLFRRPVQSPTSAVRHEQEGHGGFPGTRIAPEARHAIAGGWNDRLMRLGRIPNGPGVAIGACGVMLVACAASYGGLFSHAYPGDTNAYAAYGRALVLHGQIPYRDFYDEYPPGAEPVFALPALIWNAHYVLVFKLLMAACAIGFTACSVWILRRLELGPVRLAPIVLAPALMGPVFLNRYDPVPALISSLALIALLSARDRPAGSLLGVGTALKLYPAVVLPIVVRRARSAVTLGRWYVGAVVVLVLPFFALAPGGVGYSLWTQLKRHLQIESLGSSILLAGSKLGIHHEGWIKGKPGSIDLGGGAANAVGVISSLVAVALVLVVAREYWRGPDEDGRLVTAFAAAVTAFVVFGKVLSPQYLTWLVPLVPLVPGRKGRAAAVVFFLLLTVTQLEYLAGDHGLRRQNWTVWLLLARNGALVATFALLLGQLRDFARPASP